MKIKFVKEFYGDLIANGDEINNVKKEIISGGDDYKFVILQEEDLTIYFFPGRFTHADVAINLLEMLDLKPNAFQGAGNGRKSHTDFGSQTCREVFKRDKPADHKALLAEIEKIAQVEFYSP